ncbi:MAG: hypothetical protein JRI89_15745 [Deltaproteobacteria bacterium]|nr:hypothetical protein [Deltaproteobacteria bacterium]
MPKQQDPQDCKYYPTCERLDLLFAERHQCVSSRKWVSLPEDAEPVCAACADFDSRDLVCLPVKEATP